MKYNFDIIIDRTKNSERKWDQTYIADNYHLTGDNIINSSIADLDFLTPQPITNAILNRAEKGVYSYTYISLETLHEELSTKLTKADYDVTPIIPKEFYIKDNLIDTLHFDLTIPRKIEITCLGKNNTKGSFNTYVILPKGTVK
uniref:Uncharacterized protein n=1 Tax=Spiroplasma citri TaxID=2133 RepID=Q14LD3_SPICI|nr:hypothetical protein SPICI19_047 [Spiroplasma citri]